MCLLKQLTMDIYIVWYLSVDPQEMKPMEAITSAIHGAYKDKFTAIKTACVEQVNSLLYKDFEEDDMEENSKMADWLDEHPVPILDANMEEWAKYFESLSELVYYCPDTIVGNDCYRMYDIETIKLV